MRWFRLTLLWLALAPGLLALSARAQPALPAAGDSPANEIVRARDDLRDAASGLPTGALTDAQINGRIAAIGPIQAKLADALAILTPQLSDADARIAQLGPPPGLGQPPEAPQTADARRALARSREAVDGEVKAARLLSVEADQDANLLAERLRRDFSARLWTPSRSVLDPGLWRDFAASLPADTHHLSVATQAERARFDAAAREPGNSIAWALAVLIGLILLGPGRVILNGLAHRWAQRGSPDAPLRRSALALWLVMAAVLTPLLAGAIVRAAFVGSDALTPAFAHLSALLVRVVVFAALLEGLGRAVLSPGRPDWRLAPIPDDMVARLAPYPGLIGWAAALASLVVGVNAALGSSLPTSVASDCCTVLIELAAVGGALAMTARARVAHLAARSARPSRGAFGSRLPWVLAALAAWIAVLGALAAVVTGYLALASFLMRETVWIAAVLGILFLSLRLADDLFPALLSPRSRLGRAIETALGLSAGAMEQLGVLISGLARLVLLVLGWAAILAPFGTSPADVLGRLASANVAFHLGQAAISPGAILGSVALFLFGLAATRAVRGWMEVRYLPKTRLDVGLRTSVVAAITYFGALIAILVAFAYLGLSFSQIALFASALSVGIGFGLQSIIGNFVSGLILLAERPIQVGDWIAIGELEGDVKRINIRATEIEMMDRSKLIVPNSDLVSKAVRNVTHGAALARLRIVLKVDAAADPAAVKKTLLARLTGHGEVLREPAAAVYLSDVRDGALEFTAFAYVANPRDAFRIKSELLFQIVPDLKAKAIGLARAVPVVNVGFSERPIEPGPGPRTKGRAGGRRVGLAPAPEQG